MATFALFGSVLVVAIVIAGDRHAAREERKQDAARRTQDAAIRRGAELVGMGLEEMRAHIDGLPTEDHARALADVVAYWHEIGRQQQ